MLKSCYARSCFDWKIPHSSVSLSLYFTFFKFYRTSVIHLWRTMTTSPSSSRRYHCLMCRASFRSERGLHTHIEERHRALDEHFCHGRRPMYFQSCEVCWGNGILLPYTSILDVMLHIQRNHPEEVPTARTKFAEYVMEAREEWWPPFHVTTRNHISRRASGGANIHAGRSPGRKQISTISSYIPPFYTIVITLWYQCYCTLFP